LFSPQCSVAAAEADVETRSSRDCNATADEYPQVQGRTVRMRNRKPDLISLIGRDTTRRGKSSQFPDYQDFASAVAAAAEAAGSVSAV